MTTYATARAALVAAVGADDAPQAPPGIQVYGQGAELGGHFARGQVPWRFRVACYVGWQTDDAAASAALAVVTQAALVALRSLAGWRVEGLGQDVQRTIAGMDCLGADIVVSTMIDLE